MLSQIYGIIHIYIYIYIYNFYSTTCFVKKMGILQKSWRRRKKRNRWYFSSSRTTVVYIYFDLFPSGLPPPQYSCKQMSFRADS